jgi:uncharacterized integral membrane protein (TIGR00698 family)
MKILSGLSLAIAIALCGQLVSDYIGIHLMGLPKSPISAVMMAILLGISVRNLLRLPALIEPGLHFALQRVLPFGIALLGIRLSIAELASIGLQALPVIIGTVITALVVVTYLSAKLGITGRLGTLIAVGTSICGATAIVAISPAIAARDDEVAYSLAFVAIFGMLAILTYPYVAHWAFDAESIKSGLFLGTAIHDTAQVVGAGLVYQQYYGDPQVLDIATVTKLVRNLGMLVVIPVMSVIYHRRQSAPGEVPKWWTMIPLFVIGFAAMSLFRSIGDIGDPAFGCIELDVWNSIVNNTKNAADVLLAIAMAAIGLGTNIKHLVRMGLKPLGVGLFSAVLVGATSATLIYFLY